MSFVVISKDLAITQGYIQFSQMISNSFSLCVEFIAKVCLSFSLFDPVLEIYSKAMN